MINTDQLVVKTDRQTIEWLENNGYRNPQRLPCNYNFPVFIIDLQDKTIIGTNTTCMAAACSARRNPTVLTFNQLLEKLN